MRWTKPSEMSWLIWLAWSVLANVAFFFIKERIGWCQFHQAFWGHYDLKNWSFRRSKPCQFGFLAVAVVKICQLKTEIRVESQGLIVCNIHVWIADSNWVFESYIMKPNIFPAQNNPRFPGGRTWRRLVLWCAKPSWTSMKMARNRLMSHRLQVCATWLAG